jgi:hypothetical protein
MQYTPEERREILTKMQTASADEPQLDVNEMKRLSDSDVCQACGERWETHGERCAGSAP